MGETAGQHGRTAAPAVRAGVLPAVLPAAVLLAAVLLAAGCSGAATTGGAAGTPGTSSGAAPSTRTGSGTGAARPPSGPAASSSTSTTALLVANGNGDGDSWKDTAGREYRLGLVNTPEVRECYGSEATAARKRLVAGGFHAQVYTTDRYGRSVSVVSSADGTNVNVWLARHGFANDRYLAQFRDENPALAAQLDPAFAAAKAEHAGLWGACPAG